ncbi:MAG: GCN5-related N-acetyltransferase [uncultured Rubrobacteraceae bacterium]|uniref:GCN5-related N-acetyltransferase n=1 Tax=uncultured Rubrobacteraceae bacterium TaxID=349277 RepID=A0A6J4Q425_9ACTN|nr:MAG: GCN5-related N-acetyltransferase [uncultured Rubrobacteraceae bacterium]
MASNRREVLKAGAGLRVRRMEVSDVERVLELRSVVRWAADPRAFDLLRGVRDARWFVAGAADGGLVGMVGAVPLGAVGILCHLAVHHEHRGLGLGRELSAWAVAYLKGRGAKTIRLYATGPAEDIYRSLGFREMGRRTAYRLDGREAAPGSADLRRVDTLRFGDLPELYGVDLWSHGADRSPLIFSALGLRHGKGFVARDAAGRIEGYLILDASRDPVRIGPFSARTTDAARDLLLRTLEAAGDTPVRVIATGPNDCPSHDLFQSLGFVGREDRLRMELGEEVAGPGGLVQYGTTPFVAT